MHLGHDDRFCISCASNACHPDELVEHLKQVSYPSECTFTTASTCFNFGAGIILQGTKWPLLGPPQIVLTSVDTGYTTTITGSVTIDGHVCFNLPQYSKIHSVPIAEFEVKVVRVPHSALFILRIHSRAYDLVTEACSGMLSETFDRQNYTEIVDILSTEEKRCVIKYSLIPEEFLDSKTTLRRLDMIKYRKSALGKPLSELSLLELRAASLDSYNLPALHTPHSTVVVNSVKLGLFVDYTIERPLAFFGIRTA
jgi:hypothetical protein